MPTSIEDGTNGAVYGARSGYPKLGQTRNVPGLLSIDGLATLEWPLHNKAAYAPLSDPSPERFPRPNVAQVKLGPIANVPYRDGVLAKRQRAAHRRAAAPDNKAKAAIQHLRNGTGERVPIKKSSIWSWHF